MCSSDLRRQLRFLIYLLYQERRGLLPRKGAYHAYWDERNVVPSSTSRLLRPVTHFGKAFSSDNAGDGPPKSSKTAGGAAHTPSLPRDTVESSFSSSPSQATLAALSAQLQALTPPLPSTPPPAISVPTSVDQSVINLRILELLQHISDNLGSNPRTSSLFPHVPEYVENGAIWAHVVQIGRAHV